MHSIEAARLVIEMAQVVMREADAPDMLVRGLYGRKAGIEPAFQFLARGSVYRLPPVLFAIHAPPGRDRLGGAPRIRKRGRYKPFFEPP